MYYFTIYTILQIDNPRAIEHELDQLAGQHHGFLTHSNLEEKITDFEKAHEEGRSPVALLLFQDKPGAEAFEREIKDKNYVWRYRYGELSERKEA